MNNAPQWMTPEELAAYSRGRITVETIRHHCRAQHIPGATRAGRSWIVPADVGRAWVDRYERYGSLRREAGPDAPTPSPAIPPGSTPTRVKGTP